MSRIYVAALMLVVANQASTDNSTVLGEGDPCVELQPWETGPWGSFLEEWATSESSLHRQGRIMALPPAQGYYVSDRIDLIPPPPPPPHHHQQYRPPPPSPPRGPPHSPVPPHGMYYPPTHMQGQYEEWQATPPSPPGAGKIVNRPPNPYKDKFKPSYAQPSANQPIPVHGPPPPDSPTPGPHPPGPAADRVDEPTRPPPPQKQVSETDLYLLGAIEKLVYRVDLMEKRLRKMEENMHYLVAGAEAKPEPCVANFTRVGEGCYHFSSDALNWKNANFACRKLRANLLEIEHRDERRALLAAMFSDQRLKGSDWWTGGLNPGLLWIWSHSARPVATNDTDATGNTTSTSTSTGSQTATITGEGRCLALVHDQRVVTYVYRGQDCSLRHRFVCEKGDDKSKLGNEVERVAKKMREGSGKRRKSKVSWVDDDA